MSEFKVTYYVGAMLAQGGSLIIKEDQLLFAPRPIERAMGAVDTPIAFAEINMVEVTGTITESLIVRTVKKPHRFVGSDLYKIRDLIHTALQVFHENSPAVKSAPGPVQTSSASIQVKLKNSSSQCTSCNQLVQSEFHFCPNCHAVLKPCCGQCHRTVGAGWKYCAFCGSPV